MELYRILGVPSSASAGEIERAYTRLARRFHPRVNPGDRVASQVYDEIQRAYAVVGDPARRREYDSGGLAPPAPVIEATVEFQGFDFSSAAEGPSAATFSELFADVFQTAARKAIAPDADAELNATLDLSFLDAVRGGAFPLSLLRRERCAGCGGLGHTARPPMVCPECRGEGTRRWARGHMVFAKACDACDGRGELTRQICRACGGACVAERSEVVTIVVPPGIEDGARVAVPGRGHVEAGTGASGDLYVNVKVAPHPYFRRDGRDLSLTLPVLVHEAALGAKVDVPTIGGTVKLKIPPGTASGQRLRVRGAGVPSAHGGEAGDLIVGIEIVLPPVRDERSRELLREFGRLNAIDVRQHLR